MIQFVDGTIARAPPEEPQYIIEIIFTRNFDNVEIVRYSFSFTDLIEMFEYNQLLFFRSIVNVPDPSAEMAEMMERIIILERERGFAVGIDDEDGLWRWGRPMVNAAENRIQNNREYSLSKNYI